MSQRPRKPPKGRDTDADTFPPEEPLTSVRDSSQLQTPRETQVLPSLMAVPFVVLSEPELRGSALDHRSGFLLSLLDGETTVERLLDLSAMPSDETLDRLAELVRRGIVFLREPGKEK